MHKLLLSSTQGNLFLLQRLTYPIQQIVIRRTTSNLTDSGSFIRLLHQMFTTYITIKPLSIGTNVILAIVITYMVFR